MRVAMYYSNSDIRIEEMQIPQIGRGEILMKVTASGICGSDVLEWYRITKAPLVLGHEVAGIVEKVGKEVTRFKEGDRIVAAHHVPCNVCDYCLSGHHTVCDTLRSTNFDPGGFAEYVRIPAINVDRGVFPIPNDLSDEEATFHEPLGCVLRALRTARIQPGQSVAVFGSGIAGILMIHMARNLGAGLIAAVEPAEFRRNAALKFGADRAVHPDEDIPEFIRSINHGKLADQVIICTGAAQAQLTAPRCAERGGTILFFAPTDGEVVVPLSINDVFFRNDITLTTSYGAAPCDSQAALNILRCSNMRIKEMISHRFPLENAPQGFTLTSQAEDSMKIIIMPQE